MSKLRRARVWGVACLTLAAAVAGAGDAVASPARPTAPTPVVGAYYAGWNSAAYPVSQIPVDTVTNIFYAFSTIDQGKCTVQPGAAADFAALAQLKRTHPKLRTSISIGGWGAAGFSDAALTPASRSQFVSSCLDLFFGQYRGSFDGVDLDWEFPVSGGPAEITARPQDKADMTLLAKEFRRQLDVLGRQRGEHLLVTAALPAGRVQTEGQFDPAASFDLRGLGAVLDFVNLMTYDMGTGFSTVSTFNAPMRPVAADPLAQPAKLWNNVTGAVRYYEAYGVPADKIVLGTPFYGRGFQVKQAGPDNGLYQPYDTTFDPGDWKTIESTLLTDPAWKQYWNATAQSPWLYNAAERKFVSYENPKSIGIRAQFAKQSGLRGSFMWELSEDDAQYSLLTAMAAPFRSAR